MRHLRCLDCSSLLHFESGSDQQAQTKPRNFDQHRRRKHRQTSPKQLLPYTCAIGCSARVIPSVFAPQAPLRSRSSLSVGRSYQSQKTNPHLFVPCPRAQTNNKLVSPKGIFRQSAVAAHPQILHQKHQQGADLIRLVDHIVRLSEKHLSVPAVADSRIVFEHECIFAE